MTFILDENLSPQLTNRLSDLWDSILSVEELGLKGSDDSAIWSHAKRIADSVIISKDDDFRERALLYGPPPKVILLLTGNCSTRFLENLLREKNEEIQIFANDPEIALLELTL